MHQRVAAPLDQGLKAPQLFDLVIFAIALFLVSFSVVMVYSTTGVISTEKFGDPLYYAKRQFVAALLGIGIMLGASRLNIEVVKRLSVFALPLLLTMLLLTILPGLGDVAGGARRWVNVFGLRFQPGEFVKVLFIIFMAGYLSRHERTLSSFSVGVVKPVIVMFLTAGLFLMQPDFGSAAVLALITLCMVGTAGVRIRYFLFFGLFIALCLVAMVFLSPYRMQRVISFLYPWADASGKGYQLIQSLIAIGIGQFTGVGLGASQQKLFFLPAAHTDFIFAVIAEELGFIGCTGVILMFLLFLWRGMKLASRYAEDTFCFSLTLGLTLLIVLPALLNIGVVTGLLPTKGMVLPLIGYGGSSLLSCLLAVGLLLALARSFHKRL